VALCLAAVATLAAPVQAAFPGKPGKIVFKSTGVDIDLWSVNPDGTGRIQLTSATGSEGDPAVSADGRLVVYRAVGAGGFNQIFVMSIDGSAESPVTFDMTASSNDPTISPDGKLIAFERSDGPDTEIFVMNRDGSNQHPITANTEFDGDPQFSPDGKQIAYRSAADGGSDSEIRIVNPDGGNVRQLTTNDLEETQPNFAPDGRTIVFDRRLGMGELTVELFTMKVDGKGQRQITFDAFEQDTAVFAPDASLLAFDQDPGSGDDLINVMKPTGGPIAPIAAALGEAVDPDWAPIPVKCGGKRSTLVGTPGKDKLVGTPGRDVLSGRGGKDKLKGLGGNDILCGGAGKDVLSAAKGNKDRCIGGKAPDKPKGCESEKGI
jgi:Tol biopolymer transport system component